MSENATNTRVRFERLLVERQSEHYSLELYVTGMTDRSVEAIRTVTAACEEQLTGRYRLEVIDVYTAPIQVRDQQVFATPTLVRTQPLPIRRLIGGLSDKFRVLRGLELRIDDGKEGRGRD